MATSRRQRWHRKDYAKRRAAGICVSCDRPTPISPRTGKPSVRCERHGRMAAAASKRYVTATRQRWLAEGCCCDCGAPCGVNRQTGKPYRRCLAHRLAGAASVRAYAYRTRFEQQRNQQSTDDALVFAVIGVTSATTQTQIRRAAKMDTGRCLAALQRLTAQGAVHRYAAQAIGRGRPAFLYRRRQTTEVAA